MDDPRPVCGLQGVGEADADPGYPLTRQRPLVADDLRQGVAVHELHDDPRAAVGVEHVEDRDEPGMLEPACRACLAQHPLAQDRPLVGRDRPREADLLDGDIPP